MHVIVIIDCYCVKVKRVNNKCHLIMSWYEIGVVAHEQLMLFNLFIYTKKIMVSYFVIGRYCENAIAIESEARTPNDGRPMCVCFQRNVAIKAYRNVEEKWRVICILLFSFTRQFTNSRKSDLVESAVNLYHTLNGWFDQSNQHLRIITQAAHVWLLAISVEYIICLSFLVGSYAF